VDEHPNKPRKDTLEADLSNVNNGFVAADGSH
jgi:hypothetical protein